MRNTLLITTAAAVLAASHAAAQEFIAIPPLPGDSVTVVRAVSGDGSTVVGTSGAFPDQRAFYWTDATGLVELPFTANNSQAWDVSYDGGVIVGQDGSTGVRWVDGVMEVLQGTEEFGNFQPTSVSDDGNFAAGRAFPPGSPFYAAARWTEDGITDLGELETDDFPVLATAISSAGSIVVGISDPQAYRWTERTGMVGLGFLPGFDEYSTTQAISGNGKIIGGQADIGFDDGYVAVYWDEEMNIHEIPSVIPSASVANAVTAANFDGSWLVGLNTGSNPSAREIFVWDPVNGSRVLQETMENSFGVDFKGWQLAGLPSPFNNDGSVFGMSNSGHAIVGVTINPETETQWGWLIRLNPADLTLDGSVDVFDLLQLLDQWGACEPYNCAADINGDGVVDVFDLLALLDSWG